MVRGRNTVRSSPVPFGPIEAHTPVGSASRPVIVAGANRGVSRQFGTGLREGPWLSAACSHGQPPSVQRYRRDHSLRFRSLPGKVPTLHPIRTRSVPVVLLGALLALAFVPPALAASTAASNYDVGATVAGAALAGSAGSAGQTTLASVALRKPDGRIRYAAHGYPGRDRPTNMPFVGNNVFNATGVRQTATVENYNELDGAYYSFDISIQNDGNRSDRFKVKATGTATSGWKVAYFRGTTNITSAIVAGTFLTSSLAPSATYLIRARITVAAGGNLTRLVTIRSVAAPTRIDAVRFSYKEGSCGC
jgi:hypothetical protein